jgi:hypothetical protein
VLALVIHAFHFSAISCFTHRRNAIDLEQLIN